MEKSEQIVFLPKEHEFLKEQAVRELQEILWEEEFDKVQSQLWKTLSLLENMEFQTAKGLDFYIKVRGNEIFISRKAKSVTRASVNMALRKAIELQKEGNVVKGPKMLKSFGASYLYPIFIEIGIIKK